MSAEQEVVESHWIKVPKGAKRVKIRSVGMAATLLWDVQEVF